MKSFLNRYWLGITSSFMMVFSLLLSLQGFDLTDEGYVLVAYQNFFEDVTCASYLFPFYFTGLFGSLWNQLFGWGGWYSFRILNVLIIVAGYLLTCYTLKEYWKYKLFIFAAFFVVIFNMNVEHGTLVFHYYTFSAFTNCLAACLLYYAFKKESGCLIGVASVFLGINIFVRFPNITLCVIPYILSVINFLYNRQPRRLFLHFSIISIGILVGICLIFLLMAILGHIEIYLDSIKGLSETAQSATNNHGVVPMLKMTITNFKYILCYMTGYGLLAVVIVLGGKCFFSSNNQRLLHYYFLVFVTIFIFSYLLYCKIVGPHFPLTTNIIAFSYTLLFFTLYKEYRNKSIVNLVLLFFLISNLQPLGSDYGIGNMGPYSIWGLLPAASVLFLLCMEKHYYLRKCTNYGVLSFMLLSISYLGHIVFRQCYRDSGSRLNMTYKVSNSQLSTCYTSQERADELNALLFECRKLFKEGDTVLFALNKPGLHYLTKTKPILNNPWPILLSNSSLNNKLEKLTKKQIYPTIVESYSEGDFHFSPSERHILNQQSFQRFISREKYRIIWQSIHYRIYIKNIDIYKK